MKSRLLSRLESEIAAAGNSRQADCLRCELAAYLARLGDHDRAARELAAVQARNAAHPDPWVSAWWHFGEGLAIHFTQLSRQAHDRMKRAHAVATAAGNKPLQALAMAWLAQFEYHAIRPESMAKRAGAALALATSDNHAACARASLVVAEGYHDGGRFDLARPWYDRSHSHATAEGDDTMLSAIMSTMTSLHIADLQHRQASGMRESGDDVARAISISESVGRFDAMFGVNGLSELAPILRAQILTLTGRTGEALELYELHLEAAVARGYKMVEGGLIADRAWCRWKAGRKDKVREDADAANRCLDVPGSPSDVGAARDRLREIYEALGDFNEAHRQGVLAIVEWEKYRDLRSRYVSAMELEIDTVPRQRV